MSHVWFRLVGYFIHYDTLGGAVVFYVCFKCNSHVSEAPKDRCLYEYQYISDVAGGERPRKTEEIYISSLEVRLHCTFYVELYF